MVMQAERKPMAQPVEAHADDTILMNCIVALHNVDAQLLKHKSGKQVLSFSSSLASRSG